MTLRNNKRGGVMEDSLTILIILFVISIVGIGMGYTFMRVAETAQSSTTITPEVKTFLDTESTRFPTFFDNLFLLILFLLWLGGILLFLLIPASPAFIVFTFILLMIPLVGAAFFGNGVIGFAESNTLASYSIYFPKTLWFWNHSVEMLIIVLFTFVFALYGKIKLQGGSGGL